MKISYRCPKCDSGDWKAARMVVLEGTSETEMELDGRLVEPGLIGAGLLADRWFDLSKPLRLQAKGTAQSALANEIRRTLVHEDSLLPTPEKKQLPLIPTAPMAPRPLKIYVERDISIKIPAPVEEPYYRNPFMILCRDLLIDLIIIVSMLFLLSLVLENYTDRAASFLKRFWPEYYGLFASIGVEGWLQSYGLSSDLAKKFFNALLLVMPVSAFGVTLTVFGSMSTNRKKRKAFKRQFERTNAKRLKAIERQDELYRSRAADLLAAAEDRARYEREMEEYKKAVAAYDVELDIYNREAAEIERDFSDQVRRRNEFREALWESARVCSRCGETYWGPPPSGSPNTIVSDL